jgi:hypothetical protein
LVERRLKTHDANQLQLKLAYVVDPGIKRQSYLVESFMFVPRTLGVGTHSYSPERFYEDTQTFVRLKTPSVALEALAKPGRAEPWFESVRRGLDELLGGAATSLPQLVRSIKVLGCIYQAAIRDEGRLLRARFDRLDSRDRKARVMQEAELGRALGTFLEQLEAALERLRRTGERSLHAVAPEDVRVAWEVVDEFVALYAEEVLSTLVGACDGHGCRDSTDPLHLIRGRLADLAVEQYHYRRTRSYASYVVPGTSNETLPWRRRILKRITHSALFLDTRYGEGGAVKRDLIAGFTAAIAMLFAVLVAVWAQVEWGAVSSGFIILAVLSYIVKDRLKEWGRRYLGRRFSRWLPDFVVRLRDPQTGKVIGQSAESVTILDPSRMDAQITALRHADHPSPVARHGRAETVIRFVKEVRLDSKWLRGTIEGVDGINDIIRFNFARFRQRMDKAIEVHRVVHPTEKHLIEVPCNRVYHINLILRITRGYGKRRTSSAERVRVVLDQNGLKRVERVDGFAGEDVDQVMGSMPMVQPPARVLSIVDEEVEEEAARGSVY